MVIPAIEFDVVGVPAQNGRMADTSEPTKQQKKPSSVRHTRAIQRDRSKRPNVAPPDEQIAARLTEIVHPATLAQVAFFHRLGLRERILNLPVMVALVLSMVWRQIGGVTELAKSCAPKACCGPNRDKSASRPCRNDCAPFRPACFCECLTSFCR